MKKSKNAIFLLFSFFYDVGFKVSIDLKLLSKSSKSFDEHANVKVNTFPYSPEIRNSNLQIVLTEFKQITWSYLKLLRSKSSLITFSSFASAKMTADIMKLILNLL